MTNQDSLFRLLFAAFLVFLTGSPTAFANDACAADSEQFRDWAHSGSVYLLTTPEGAELPQGTIVREFPVLVRLHQDFFDFRQAQAHGEDLRVSTSAGMPLAYQIEHWDADLGIASVWVRVPVIEGNSRQEIRLHWGNTTAVSESSGNAVFNESNGYRAVFHMNDPVQDETGRLESRDTGTVEVPGIVGAARHFPGGRGIFCGDKITGFPAGSSPNTTSAWFWSDVANGRVLGWGNEAPQGKVIMNFRSPPHVRMECYFSGADVAGQSQVQKSEWIHVVHTYEKGESLLYVNGVLDGTVRTDSAPLAIKSPARMWIGGWYDVYEFAGDVDEVRIANVVRSADWARLEYENQKPFQTLVGPVVQPGDAFSVTPTESTIAEGQSVTFTAQAGDAQKVYWVLKRDETESVVATDRFSYTLDAGRVAGDQQVTLQFKAICANEIKVCEIPVRIEETLPEPVFRLQAPHDWDGRATIEVVSQIVNLSAMQANGVGDVAIRWSTAGLAAITEAAPGRLILSRAQNSGRLTVTATLSNGGPPATQSIEISVTEPAHDPWLQRIPEKDEHPVDHQFYARNDQNQGTLFCNGTLDVAADAVFVRLYADGRLVKTDSQQLAADNSYAFQVTLKPGLIKYRFELGTTTGNTETILRTAENLVCGDAYLITGQSNAVATDWSGEASEFSSDWIRSYGALGETGDGGWGNAVRREGRHWQIGYWGMDLARHLVETQKIPICIINGAVGGTRIDQHQVNPAEPTDPQTIFGRMLSRVRQAKLTNSIRAVLWHQGEADQGADGPDGVYGCENYQQYFLDMAAAWKRHMPNIQHYYLFQIWPNACSQGGARHSDKLRDVQRQLPLQFSKMSVMSTVGIKPEGPCHYPAEGYAQFARLITPLVERDHYGKHVEGPITPPDLLKARYTSEARDEISLVFDQPMLWDESLASQFSLDGEAGNIATGMAAGNVVTLKLRSPAAAATITYLTDRQWNPKTLLYGKNGIAALTFCEVPIQSEETGER